MAGPSSEQSSIEKINHQPPDLSLGTAINIETNLSQSLTPVLDGDTKQILHNGVLKKWPGKFRDIRIANGRFFDVGAEFFMARYSASYVDKVLSVDRKIECYGYGHNKKHARRHTAHILWLP